MTRLSYPPMEELTRLVNVDNGGNYYGVHVDNDAGDAYAVRMESASVLATGIADAAFPYGNDIDTALPVTTDLSIFDIFAKMSKILRTSSTGSMHGAGTPL